jgi:TetR/AcrR family transcriptional regulator
MLRSSTLSPLRQQGADVRGLIDFIEQSLFSVINQITSEESQGLKQIELIIGLLLRFAQRNRGMTRVLIGDALVNEHERLQTRINALLDKIEAAMKQACASPPRRKT